MKTKNILILSAATALLSTANATIIFQDDFESYTQGTSINGQGGWTADSYTIVSYDGGNGVQSPNNVLDASISHAFTEQTGTVYIGVDVDFRPGATNFFWILASDDADYFNSGGATFSNSSEPTVRARNFDDDSSYNASYTAYGDPTRIVITISASGANGSNYDTTTIWSEATGTIISTITGDTGISALDTFFAKRGTDTNGNSMIMDNLVVATTFNEAAMIPEPSTYAMIAGAGIMVLTMMRRRRKQIR
ncbi:PEP-CTERM sorting domain-containing protein [Cerasicoccus frondis]|uniref:PEP-CTERM sorting domain-containing protein n=1 Tax=Cerasicoccus frondis TaxID=490090 RepID=UPI002852BFC9|nr:PEP-CTERM sorting domain-containing protein [Cerasicoccus frondis]